MVEYNRRSTDLLAAEAKRQDDLRDAEARRQDNLRDADQIASALVRSGDKEAILVATKALEYRLEEMNKLREQIESERGQFVRKDWFEPIHKELEARTSRLEEWRWKVVGGLAVAMLVGSFFGWIISIMTQKLMMSGH